MAGFLSMERQPDKIGVIMPAFSNQVHWYQGMFSIRDAVDLVMSQNKFMDANRLSFRLNGKPVAVDHTIRLGDVIEVDGTVPNYHDKTVLEELLKRIRLEAKLAEGTNSIIWPWEEEAMWGTPPPNEDGYDGEYRKRDRYTIKEVRQMAAESGIKPPSPPWVAKFWGTKYDEPGRGGRRYVRHAPTNRPRVGREPRPLAERVGPKISQLSTIERRRLKHAPRYPARKIKLRFHFTEFGEQPVELWATNFEPLQLHFNVIRMKLIRMRAINKEDELNFIWPHLRWIPCGNTRVHSIRTNANVKTYACLVSKRGTEIGDPGRDDDYGQEREESDHEQREEEPEDEEQQDNEHYDEEQYDEEQEDKDTASHTENTEGANEGPIWSDGDNIHTLESQGDLISFSRQVSPFPAATESVSELSTIGGEGSNHRSNNQGGNSNKQCGKAIATYMTNDDEYTDLTDHGW
ncbi:hypothetical protein TWF281_004100 [Arthrobotrys megalospora]